jgi:hypothetical protein
MLKLHEFYRRFANLPLEKRNQLLQNVQHNPLTPFFIFKQIEETKKMQRFFQQREEELLRIAEETFNQVEQ